MASASRCTTVRCTSSRPTPGSSNATTTGRSSPGGAQANAVIGSERVFGFGSSAATTLPYAEVVTEVRHIDGHFMASEAHHLDQGPEPSADYDLDLTPWIEAPSAHELVGRIREVREGRDVRAVPDKPRR